MICSKKLARGLARCFQQLYNRFCVFAFYFILKKNYDQIGYSYARMLENLMPAHQAGGNTQGVGMPQMSVGFRGVFGWSPNAKCVADKNAIVLR